MVADQPPRPANMLHIVAVNQGRAPYSMDAPSPQVVDAAEAEALLADGAVPIDVRDWSIHGAAHPAGSINVPLSSDGFEQNVGWLLPAGRRALLIVERDADAARAASRLAFVGLDGRVAGAIPFEAWVGARRPVEPLRQLSPEEAHAGMNGAGLALLDVRDANEWHAFRVDGAHHCDFRYLPGRIDRLSLDRDHDVAVICAGGLRSSIGASLLRRAGFRSVANVSGGMIAWRAAGLPILEG